MTFTTNNHPAPVDLRGLPPDVANSIYRPARNASTPNNPVTTDAKGTKDPIRDMVVAALQLVGIPIEGKTDSQLLADYTEQLRKTARAPLAAAHNEFTGYSINSLIDAGGSYDLNNPSGAGG